MLAIEVQTMTSLLIFSQSSYKYKANSINEGDLHVHHAGHKSLRAQWMMPWIEAAEQHLSSWELDLSDTTYQQEIADF